VTAAGLHNLIDGTDIYQALITDQPSLTAVDPADSILIADASLTAGDAPRQTTVSNLFDDALTGGTYTNLNLTGALTFGTATGNRTVSTSATITTGTIPNLTAGTTISTSATITNGTITTALIPTLTAGTTTGTAGIFTSGTIATLNSTTGTITNLSTTLAGDFTISQGTGTLGTTGATLGTYGGATSVPVLAINAKGQVTSTGTAAITSGLTGFRNRIINGDMRIDQRNAGASVTTTNGIYTLDRWNFSLTQASKLTAQQVTISSPESAGNNNKSLKITSSSAYSIVSSDYFLLGQFVEGLNSSDLGWGTSGAKTITLSFWVRSSLTGVFGGVFTNSATARAYPFTYTISSANTWEQKTITASGDTSGTWLTDSGIGIRLYLGLGVGSDFNGTAGAWGAGKLGATGATSVVGTNGATWEITGVQLEAGSTATEFERRPIGTELALCQRYYWRIDGYNAISAIGSGSVYSSTTTCRIYSKYPVSMRSYPTLSMAGSLVSSGGNADNSVSAISASNAGLESTLIDFTTAAGTLGHGKVIYVSSSTSYNVNYVQAAIEL
jgi:hypothetical protein